MVVACSGPKVDHPAPAGELYTGQLFRTSLAAALAEAGGDRSRVYVLSALHGLVAIDDIVAPYDQRIDQAGAIVDTVLALQIAATGCDEMYVFGPNAYYAHAWRAGDLADVSVHHVFEGNIGIGTMLRGATIVRGDTTTQEAHDMAQHDQDSAALREAHASDPFLAIIDAVIESFLADRDGQQISFRGMARALMGEVTVDADPRERPLYDAVHYALDELDLDVDMLVGRIEDVADMTTLATIYPIENEVTA